MHKYSWGELGHFIEPHPAVALKFNIPGLFFLIFVFSNGSQQQMQPLRKSVHG